MESNTVVSNDLGIEGSSTISLAPFTSTAISGTSGGTGLGTTDLWANIAY